MWIAAFLFDTGKPWLGSVAMVQTMVIGIAATAAAVFRLYKVFVSK